MSELLHLASGEVAAWQNGTYVSSDQAEMYSMGDVFDPTATAAQRRYAGIAWQISVVELADGTWLAKPYGLAIYDQRFPSRSSALRAAAARVIRIARMDARIPAGSLISWRKIDAAEYRTVVDWVYSVLEKPVPAYRIPAPPATRRFRQGDLFEAHSGL